MKESLRDYPSLQMEDDGFLLSLKMDFVDSRKELFGAEENSSFKEMVERLIEGNRAVLDKGSQLPLYVPVFSDDGEMVGSRAVPVWSGVHIDFPLYPGLSKDSVEMFLYGNPRRIGYLGPEFLECDPAFKLALLVHFAIDNIHIHELAIEAFLLGVYAEIPFEDKHFEETGLPETQLAMVASSTGLYAKRMRMPDGGLCISHGIAKTDGWVVRVRGTKPKERVLRDCWQEMRARNASAEKPLFTINGEEYAAAPTGPDGRKHERSGSAAVDYMVAWIDALQAKYGLPMHGTRVDWVGIHRRFENENPSYTCCWTADTMRRTYNRRKAKQS